MLMASILSAAVADAIVWAASAAMSTPADRSCGIFRGFYLHFDFMMMDEAMKRTRWKNILQQA
jgi:hypothetical protein